MAPRRTRPAESVARGKSVPLVDSVLCWLGPKNNKALMVIAWNRGTHQRVTSLKTEHGYIEAIQITFNEPKQRRGLLIFGRHHSCGVRIQDQSVSLEHGYIDLNTGSGELRVWHTSRNSITHVDDEPVIDPPHRALIYQHTKSLRVWDADFEIHWPSIPQNRLEAYHSEKLRLAARIHLDHEISDLTEPEIESRSLPSTQSSIWGSSPSNTPMTTENHDRSHVKREELGHGAFGIVYKAVERLNGDFIAVKQLSSTASDLDTVKNEVEILGRLRHDNIIRMLGWRKLPQLFEIDLEYCSRGNLYSIRAELQQCGTEMAIQVSRGLAYLHQMQFIHRDVKPDNILVHDADGCLLFKLADFGLSTTTNLARTKCGTPMYMAPEACLSQTQTISIDIYSFGVTLLDIGGYLHGFKQNRARFHNWHAAISRSAALFRPGVDADMVRAMVSRDASHRPSASQCLQYQWSPWE